MAIALSNAAVGGLLDDKDWSVLAIGPWTTDDPAELLGVAMELSLGAPHHIDAQWPVYVPSADSSEAFAGVTAHVTADAVTAIRVMVDLRTGVVAKVVPVDGSNERIDLPSSVTERIPPVEDSDD